MWGCCLCKFFQPDETCHCHNILQYRNPRWKWFHLGRSFSKLVSTHKYMRPCQLQLRQEYSVTATWKTLHSKHWKRVKAPLYIYICIWLAVCIYSLDIVYNYELYMYTQIYCIFILYTYFHICTYTHQNTISYSISDSAFAVILRAGVAWAIWHWPNWGGKEASPGRAGIVGKPQPGSL